MFARLGHFIYKRRWLVLALGIVFMLVSGWLGTGVFGSLKTGGYDNPGSESAKVAAGMKEYLGRDDRVLIILFNSLDGKTVDDPAFKVAVQATLDTVKGKPYAGEMTTYYDTGAAQLVSTDRTATYALMGMKGSEDDQLSAMREVRGLLKSDTLQVRLGGYPAVSQDLTEQVSKDLERGELISFPIVFILLLVIFGSLTAAALPLFIGGFAILGGFLILRIAAQFTDMSLYAVNIISMLGLGLAIDYSLFMVSRFREELIRHEGDISPALARTMQTAGRTVMFSGFTVMVSLLSLLFFPQMFMKGLAIGGASAVLVAMIATVTVLPAALALLGQRVNSLSVRSLLPKRFHKPATAPHMIDAPGGLWYRISTLVMRRPVVVLLATIIPIAIVGLPFLRIYIGIPDHRALPESHQSRQVGDVLLAEFPRNETQPIQVLVNTGDKGALDPSTLGALYDYTRELGSLPGVRRVESVVNLDPRLDALGKAGYVQFYGAMTNPLNPQGLLAQRAAAHYANGSYTVVDVLYDSEPLAPESRTLAQAVRDMRPPAGFTAQVGGRTAELMDFLASLEAVLPVAIGFIVVVLFVLLFLMLGSLVVPATAVLLNTLSLSASFGALVWIFQEGHLSNLLGFTPTGNIDGTMPVLIFAMAFGLSMDYEVFLLSRIKEQYDRTGNTTESVALGIQKTGSIITSAALLLVVVIGSFALGEVMFIKQVGIGLGLAILVDATIVRALLVPAAMRLLGKYNWWAPRPLQALYRKLGMSEVDVDESAEGALAVPLHVQVTDEDKVAS